MAYLEWLLSTSAIAWLIGGVLVVEAVFLLALWQVRRVGLAPASTVCFLGAGLCFAVALGIVLSAEHWAYLAPTLFAAFLFHIGDLALRWRGR
ncbi:MAG: hypothetical protein AAGM04_07455 [Pseudomonadota bacterium]